MDSLHILIAGGGIGGLTAALSLAQSGHQVTVCEQAKEFAEIGAGIQLSPNASRVLVHIGLEEGLDELGFLPKATQFRQWRSGKVISESPLGDTVQQTYGAPYYHMHRGDLLSLLVKQAQLSPNIHLVNGAKVIEFVETDGSIVVELTGESIKADLLVGADGIHSSIRQQLWGEEKARFTGNVAWRALVPTAKLPPELIRPMSTAWWGPHKHFVHYYVRRGEFVNCVCVVEKEGWETESWTEPGDYAELKKDFSGWHEDLQLLIEQMDPDSLFRWALHDREPMSLWGKGLVTLLGDACHPTLPFMAQGAAMAIEDGAVLALCLDDAPSIEDALQRYEALRKPRTAKIQNGSRRNASVFHLSGIQAWLRNRAAKRAGGRAMDNLFRYDALDQTMV